MLDAQFPGIVIYLYDPIDRYQKYAMHIDVGQSVGPSKLVSCSIPIFDIVEIHTRAQMIVDSLLSL